MDAARMQLSGVPQIYSLSVSEMTASSRTTPQLKPQGSRA
jgi:hypothetical protein